MGKNLRSELRTLRRIVAGYPASPFTQAHVDMLRTFASPPDLPAYAPLMELADLIEALIPK